MSPRPRPPPVPPPVFLLLFSYLFERKDCFNGADKQNTISIRDHSSIVYMIVFEVDIFETNLAE